MRALKLCMALGVALALSGVAGGVTIPSVPNGPTYLESNDMDNGTAYVVDETTAPTPPFSFSPQVSIPSYITRNQAAGNKTATEDTWGVWTLYYIAKGKAGANNIDADIPNVVYYDWSTAAGATWLVGMFWGGSDAKVTIKAYDFTAPYTAGGTLSEFEVEVDHVQAELWAVDKSEIEATGGKNGTPYDATRRTAVNRYTDWMEDSFLTAGTAEKVLRAESTTFRFTGKLIDMTGNGYTADDQFEGETTAYWNVNTALTEFAWNPYWGLSDFFTDEKGGTADMKFSWELETTTFGWDTASTDKGGVNVVPEPLTMLAMFSGLIGVAGYIRRRRA